MVSSVQSTTAYAPTPAAIAVVARQNADQDSGAAAAQSGGGDTVSLSQSYDADISAARDALAGASGSLDLALATGREAAGIVTQMRDLARAASSGGDDARAAAQQSFQALQQRYSQVVGDAVNSGASVLAGDSMTVAVDPDTAPVTVQGYDLRMKDQAGSDDVLRLTTGSNVSDQGSATAAAQDADASLARIDTALSKLSGASQKLSAHDAFLSSLDSAVSSGVSTDMDADTARLTALQVSQTLSGANSAIANSSPSSLLALFRE